MAEIFNREFIDISVPVLVRISGKLLFDVYIKRGENLYTRIFPKGDPIDTKRVTGYQTKKGVETFYVHHDEYRQYLFYVEQVANRFFNKKSKMSADEVVQVVKEMTNLTMLEIVVNTNVDQTSVSHASQTIQGCLDALHKDPKSLIKIFELLSRHPYSIKHALSASIFSLLLAKKEKLESERSLKTLGMGALLHDIGMAHLPFDAEDKTDLSPQEWKEIKEHPQLGKRMVDSVKTVNPEVRMIIMQHHEQPNGMGYPNGMRDKEIYYLSKIVSIADSFSALVSKRPFRESPCSPGQALQIMVEDRGKFDSRLLEQFSSIFVKTRTEEEMKEDIEN